jgi:hypothetical protein
MTKSNMCICSSAVELKLSSRNCLYFLIHPSNTTQCRESQPMFWSSTVLPSSGYACCLLSLLLDTEGIGTMFLQTSTAFHWTTWHCVPEDKLFKMNLFLCYGVSLTNAFRHRIIYHECHLLLLNNYDISDCWICWILSIV